MNRFAPGTPEAHGFVGEVIRSEANALARRHGVDAERVDSILLRCATDADGRPLVAEDPFTDFLVQGLWFRPSLDEALELGEPLKATRHRCPVEPATSGRISRWPSHPRDRVPGSATLLCQFAAFASPLAAYPAGRRKKCRMFRGDPAALFRVVCRARQRKNRPMFVLREHAAPEGSTRGRGCSVRGIAAEARGAGGLHGSRRHGSTTSTGPDTRARGHVAVYP